MRNPVISPTSHMNMENTKFARSFRKGREMKGHFASRKSQMIWRSRTVLAIPVNFLKFVFMSYIVFVMNSFFLSSKPRLRQLKSKVDPTAKFRFSF